jgi:hypothetical protein
VLISSRGPSRHGPVQVRAAAADWACRRVWRRPPWCFVRSSAMEDSHGQSSHARARGCLALQTAGHGLARSAAASLSLRPTFPRHVMSCTPDPPRDSAPAFTHLPSADSARAPNGRQLPPPSLSSHNTAMSAADWSVCLAPLTSRLLLFAASPSSNVAVPPRENC